MSVDETLPYDSNEKFLESFCDSDATTADPESTLVNADLNLEVLDFIYFITFSNLPFFPLTQTLLDLTRQHLTLGLHCSSNIPVRSHHSWYHPWKIRSDNAELPYFSEIRFMLDMHL